MRKVWSAVKSAFRASRLWVARQLVGRYDCQITRGEAISTLIAHVAGFERYTERSGHLTRAYHAGRRARRLAAVMRETIANSRAA